MKKSFPRTETICAWLLLLALTAQVLFMFSSYLTGTMLLPNDYMDIPEETRVGNEYIPNQDLWRLSLEVTQAQPGAQAEVLNSEGSEAAGFSRLDQFLSKNRFELSFQVHLGWIMHHHNIVLGPINEYTLGKSPKEINHQYGWLNTILLAHLLKVTGGLSFQNYIRILYSFYPLYYLLYLAAAFVLFRNIGYVLLTALVSFSFLNVLGFTSILLAPGFSPLRQLYYLPVTAFLFLFLKQRKPVFLVLSLFSSIIFLLSSKEFGFFCIAALLVTLALRLIQEQGGRHMRDVLLISCTAIITVLILLFGQLGKNPLGHYYLEGISGPIMYQSLFYLLLAGTSLVYALLLRLMAFRNALKYVALFLFLYCQGILIYYVWNPSPNHFYATAAPMVLMIVLILKLSMEETGLKRYRKPVLAILSSCVFLAFYLPSLQAYYTEKDAFDEIFRNHKVYAWSFPRARIRTTMGPQYVSEAVDMIKEYSPGQKAVYMVSKYDNLFPFLAERYSAMPFYEVATSLLTQKEVDECIKAIRADQPRFLFVDTEIVEQPEARPDYWSRPLYRLAAEQFDLRPRIQMLETLAQVYAGVSDMYKVGEKGSLISVCEKR